MSHEKVSDFSNFSVENRKNRHSCVDNLLLYYIRSSKPKALYLEIFRSFFFIHHHHHRHSTKVLIKKSIHTNIIFLSAQCFFCLYIWFSNRYIMRYYDFD